MTGGRVHHISGQSEIQTFLTTQEGSGENLARKCLEYWNPAVSVDEGKNSTSANQRSSPTNDRK